MRLQKVMYLLVLAFLLSIVACGDDSSASANQDDDTSLEDKSKSSSVEKSSSSKSKKSSSSGKDSKSSSSSVSASKISSSQNVADETSKFKKGTFVDKRDNKKYMTVTIEGQTWMAQNLNYAPASSRGCHKDDDKDCSKYGRIYTWGEIIDSTKSLCGYNIICDQPVQGICPDGWRIPNLRDWRVLLDNLNGSSPTFFKYEGLGPYLFSRDNGYYEGYDSYGLSITAPKYDYEPALNFFTSTQSEWSNGDVTPDLVRIGYDIKKDGFAKFTTPASLRCIKGDLIPDLQYYTSTFGVRGDDRKTCNGAEPDISSYRICNKNGENKCYRKEDGSITIGSQTMYIEENGKKECPFEWHVPDSSEWETLFLNAGGSCFAGFTLKAQEGWGDDYAFDAFGLGIKPTDGKNARFLVRGLERGKYTQNVLFAKGSNIAVFEENVKNTSGLLCIKGRLEDDTLSLTNPDLEYGQFTDTRDNRTYKTINIGTIQWMAENLNYATDSSVCYNKSERDFDCNRYGRFYSFDEAKKACPAGWRLPTKKELDTLLYITSPYNRTYNLVSAENPFYKGENTSGFSLVTMGYQHYNGNFYENEKKAYLWSGTKVEDSVAYVLDIYHDSYISDTAYVTKFYTSYKINVRCVSEEKVQFGYMGTYGTLTDNRDGQEYKTVEINGTTWMAENLNYTSDNSTCLHDSCDFFGKHYTYPFTTNISKSLCPNGWHISTTADWDSLLAFTHAGDSLERADDLRYPFAWPAEIQGNDKYGMSLIPNSCYQDNYGYDVLNTGNDPVACIGAEDIEENKGYYYILTSNMANHYSERVWKRTIKKDDTRFRFGIRCVKDK